MEKKDYITKEDVLEILKDKYDICISPRTLKYYGTLGLIAPGFKGTLEGRTGSVSFYKKNTPEIIHLIRYLKIAEELTLKEIKSYFDILSFKNARKLNELINFSKRIIKDSVILDSPITKKELLRLKSFNKAMAKRIAFWDVLSELSRRERERKNLYIIAKMRSLLELGLFFLDSYKNLDKLFTILDRSKVKIEEEYILVQFDRPVNKKVYFKKNKIRIEDIKD